MSAFDDKLRELVAVIDLYIYKLSKGDRITPRTTNHDDGEDLQSGTHLSALIDNVEHQILAAVVDNLNLNSGLEAIVNLHELFPKVVECEDMVQRERSILLDCIRLRLLIQRWLDATGLEYGEATSSSGSSTINHNALIEHLSELRLNTRQIALASLRTLQDLKKNEQAANKQAIDQLCKQAQQMLTYCDETRNFMEAYGIKLKVRLLPFSYSLYTFGY